MNQQGGKNQGRWEKESYKKGATHGLILGLILGLAAFWLYTSYFSTSQSASSQEPWEGMWVSEEFWKDGEKCFGTIVLYQSGEQVEGYNINCDDRLIQLYGKVNEGTFVGHWQDANREDYSGNIKFSLGFTGKYTFRDSSNYWLGRNTNIKMTHQICSSSALELRTLRDDERKSHRITQLNYGDSIRYLLSHNKQYVISAIIDDTLRVGYIKNLNANQLCGPTLHEFN